MTPGFFCCGFCGRIQDGSTPNPNSWPSKNCHTRQLNPTPEASVSLLVSWNYSDLHSYTFVMNWYAYVLLIGTITHITIVSCIIWYAFGVINVRHNYISRVVQPFKRKRLYHSISGLSRVNDRIRDEVAVCCGGSTIRRYITWRLHT